MNLLFRTSLSSMTLPQAAFRRYLCATFLLCFASTGNSALAAATTTTVTASDANPVYGEYVTLTATVAGSNPTGSVAFSIDGTNIVICAGSALNGSGNSRTARCNWQTSLTPSAYSVVATYSGDSSNDSSMSSDLSVSISQSQTVVTATATPNQFVLNQPTSVSAQVTPVAPGSGTPTGEVDVSFGSINCKYALPRQTSCSITPTQTGSFDLEVTYEGDADFGPQFFSKTNVVVPPSTTQISSSNNPSAFGELVTFTASVAGNAPTGKVIFLDGSNPLCNASGQSLSDNHASCSVNTLTPGAHTITAKYSGDSNNGASSANLVQTVNAAALVNLDQQGITGSWYNPSTTGQGFVLQVFPDLGGVNNGLLAGSWFTFDVAPAGGLDKQRWYTFSSPVSSNVPTATFTIDTVLGGNFNSGPKVGGTTVGQGSLELADCSHGTLTYQFTDGSGLSGTIPLTRIAANVTCGTNGNNGAKVGSYLLSGAWYDPNTSGQGFLFEVNPLNNLFAAAWYTFAPNGSSDSSTSQRWYTLQTGFTAGSTQVSNIPIYTGYGGVFNNDAPTSQPQVGTANILFSSCSAATLGYAFSATGSDNDGLSGTIHLQRVGPAPDGCSLSQ